MKLQLDFNNKIITLENDVSLKEFIKIIKKIIPDWEQWTLRQKVITTWYNPIYIPLRDVTCPDWTYKPTTICDTLVIN